MDHPDTCTDPQPAYYCPTVGEFESPCHGGFDRCCQFPILHLPVREDDPLAIYRYAAARERVGMATTRDMCDAVYVIEQALDLLADVETAEPVWDARKRLLQGRAEELLKRIT